MIDKRDCFILLSELQEDGVENTEKYINELLASKQPSLEVIKFINDNRQFDANKFYEKIRKSYNSKKSKLYMNIVREDNFDADEILTTLASLNLQILLFSKNVEDKQMFLKHMRFNDICEVLLNYANNFDLVPCVQMLQVIKSDLKAFEYIYRA